MIRGFKQALGGEPAGPWQPPRAVRVVQAGKLDDGSLTMDSLSHYRSTNGYVSASHEVSFLA